MTKKRIYLGLLAAALVAGIAPRAVRAEGILDQQLGPRGSSQEEPKKQPTPKPAAAQTPGSRDASARSKNPGKHSAPDAIDPNAAKTVDDADLVKKLTGQGEEQGDDDPAAKMKEMLDRMGQSQSRLSDKDTGAVTQETQRRIVKDLDVMIEYARKQQQQQGSSKSSSRQGQAEKRQMSQGQQQQSTSNQRGNQAAQNSYIPRGGAAAPESNGEDMRQKGPQEWGGLPPRDRDLISNGASEQYLPSYKELIDRYYQALAEVGKSKEHP